MRTGIKRHIRKQLGARRVTVFAHNEHIEPRHVLGGRWPSVRCSPWRLRRCGSALSRDPCSSEHLLYGVLWACCHSRSLPQTVRGDEERCDSGWFNGIRSLISSSEILHHARVVVRITSNVPMFLCFCCRIQSAGLSREPLLMKNREWVSPVQR